MTRPERRYSPETLLGLEHQTGPITVEVCDEEMFIRLRQQPRTRVRENDIATLPITENILNEFAGPCTIFYLYNQAERTMTSAHFPFVNPEQHDDHLRAEIEYDEDFFRKNSAPEGLALPTSFDTSALGITRLIRGYFEPLLGELSAQLARTQPRDLNLYLIGRNLPVHDGPITHQQIVENLIDQHSLISILNQLGLPSSRIHDFRQPHQKGTDNTFYLGSEQKIYWRRSKIK